MMEEPSLEVVAAEVNVCIAIVGLVKPEMVNVMGWPPANVPEVNETVKIDEPPTLRDAVPAAPPDAGAMNATAALPEFARAIEP